MAWYTDLFCNITFNRETFNNIYEVNNRIDELEACLQTAKNDIRNLVMITEPNKFCGDDEPLCWLNKEFRNNMELIEEYSVELYKLKLLRNNWDACHNESGLAIDLPDNISYYDAFLEGDFIKSVKHPNINE